ncbi:MAG TPA: DUF58 domain-containing protein [Myxococcales bacterium]|nr:DUF58 domain-containing protein [Deltaproteobacteria bacterium]MBU54312.1 DUF58 domain-containing protein [Deltaproteobacteria bacterium]HAA57005.1 DUF58 domain-containing protein [Myxococcales bacterium]|tara:strand:- start:290 stop:1165 length:876 start_codon:yes stop_codon:yes gene_type:complete
MLSRDLLQQIKSIHLTTSYLVNEAMAGEYASAFKGRGMEFEEVREYRPGDDVRTIDWKVTARMGHPFVKEYREERELTIFLMVDMSGSGRFGSHHKSKTELMAETAAVLAYLASRNNDKVGMMLFTTEVERFIPPKKGRGHVWRLIQEILTFEPEHKGTDLTVALDYAGHLLRKKTVLFLISDFIDDHYERALTLASKRHDITALHVVDPLELALPNVGLIELEDAETGQIGLFDTSDKRVREHFHKRALHMKQSTRETLRRAGIDEVEISTTGSCADPLMRYFRRRERRR